MNKYIFLFLFTFICLGICAQPELKFVRYTTEHGLSNNDVLSICQDNYGFIWIGTKNGCSRFDGIKFKTFQYDENIIGTIGPGWVNGIVCDKNNNLWFALSGAGSPIMKYDYQKDIFIDMSQPFKDRLGIPDEKVDSWKIFCDSEGLLWLLLKDVAQYNPQTGEIINFSEKNESLKNYAVKDFFEDVDGNIWILGGGCVVYHKKDDSFTFIEKGQDLEKGRLNSGIVYCGYQDLEKNVWIGSRDGFYKLITPVKESALFKNFTHDPRNPFSLSNDMVYDFAEDADNNLFIGTINGLCLLDKKTEKMYRYYNDEIDPESINSNLIRTLYRDKHNTLWVGTSSGVAKLQPKNFHSYSQSLYKNSISHNKVQCVSQGPGSEVWIGTPKGIDVFDNETREFRFFMGIDGSAKGLRGSPLTMCNEGGNGMWIGTWGGGFSYVDYSANKVVNYISNPATSGIHHVFSIFSDNRNALWIGVNTKPNKGGYLYNVEKDTFRIFSHNPNNESTISSNRISYIMRDSKGQIWFGTRNGLNLLTDVDKGIFKSYLKDISINHLIESFDKHLWIGTEKGLYRFTEEEQQFKKFDAENGLPGNRILSILEDQFSNLWVSTDKGLARFQPTNDESIPLVNVFRSEEGLSAGDFLPASCAKLSDSAMVFGGTDGFCLFYPNKIRIDTVAPIVVFKDLKIANRKIIVGDTINDQVILSQSITTTKHLILNHKNNELAIELAGLQYNMPQHIKYAYRLEGYDKPDSHWRYKTALDREVEYMNLPAGDYTLNVKAANSYGIWSNQSAELKITVLPPWRQTIWFKSLVTAILIFIVFMAIRIRTYSLQKQKQKLKQIVEQRTIELKEMNVLLNERKEELEAQAEELSEINLKLLKTNTELEVKTIEVEKIAKQLHEADQSKLRFFANISHEFRTPLTLIISPLEKCLNLPQPVDWDKINIRNYLQLMHKNSKRLLRLINQVIDFRKIDRGEKKLNLSNNNIVAFVKEVIEAFSTQAEQKNITLEMESQYPVISFWFDSDVMEKILYNLISNAIKYTPEGGNVSVQLSVNSEQSAENSDQLPVSSNQLTENNQQSTVNSNQSYNSPLNTDNCLLITVKDTGIGIKEENLNRIFDRFYRVEAKESLKEEGTGIGLSYTKELVELHKGKISVESVYGKGVSFTLEFSGEKEHFDNETIIENSTELNLSYIHSMIDPFEDMAKTQSFTLENENEWEGELTGRKQTVLLVEDNNDLRKFIKDELLPHYDVHEAENGKEGLNLALELEPELIISDIMMPVMDGKELCERIKSDENTSHIPVILLTAKGGGENILEGLEIGANDYITKPFDVNMLKIKIKNLFLLQKRIQERFNKSIDVIPKEMADSPIDQEFIQKALEVVNEHMHDYKFDNDAFISHMNYSRALVYKKMKNIIGQSVSEFIRSVRIKAAAQYFLKGHKNIAEVGYKVGFKHQSVFTRHFNEVFGMSPRQFIKEKLEK